MDKLRVCKVPGQRFAIALEGDLAEFSKDSVGLTFLASLMAELDVKEIRPAKGLIFVTTKTQNLCGQPWRDLGHAIEFRTSDGKVVIVDKADVMDGGNIQHSQRILSNEEIVIRAAPDIDTGDRTVRKQLLEATQAAGFQRARVISEQVEPRAMTAEASW